MTYEALLLPFFIALLSTPVIHRLAIRAGLYAAENERTVHHGQIPRIGGVAIFLAASISMALFLQPTRQMSGILAGTSIMMFTGLIDDLISLRPRTKLLVELVCALILIGCGVSLNTLRLPFGISVSFGPLSMVITIVWIVGITNAVNLMDGLDGLAAGMAAIIMVVIGCTALIEGKMQIVYFAFILAASVGGFLPYNLHPASIFMGDCGSLYLGFSIAALSLVGFKSSTILTLALPILLLFLPIVDTLSAIARRTLQHKRFSEADKSHLHHLLMNRFGHRNTVFILWTITALFGLSAFLYMIDKVAGALLMAVIVAVVELFIERSAMVSARFHPVLSALHWGRKKLFRWKADSDSGSSARSSACDI